MSSGLPTSQPAQVESSFSRFDILEKETSVANIKGAIETVQICRLINSFVYRMLL